MARFTELARFADDYVATDMAKVRRFENGLKLSIRGRIVGLHLPDMDFMVETALTIEREIEDARSTRDAGVSSKRKESRSSSSSGKKQRASSSRGFQGRGHPGQGWIRVSSQAGRMLPLPTTRTYQEGLPLETRIPRFWDSAVPVNGRTGEDTVYSSTAQYRPEEPVSVSGSCTGTSRYASRLERLGYGPRQRTRPTSRGVRGSGACLRHHTTG